MADSHAVAHGLIISSKESSLPHSPVGARGLLLLNGALWALQFNNSISVRPSTYASAAAILRKSASLFE